MTPTDESAPRTAEQGGDANPYASRQAVAPAASAAQFSLVTLLLVMTLVAFCLGVTMAAPGVGALLIVLATPALVRTMVAGFRQKQVGTPFTTAEKIEAFCVSLGVMLMIGAAAVVAFQVACWGTAALVNTIAGDQSWESGFIAGLSLGSIAGLAAIVWLLWLTRPRKPTPASKASF